MKDKVENTRFICGLLSEIEATRSLLFCRSTNLNKSPTIHKLKIEIKSPYENSIIFLNELNSEEDIDCETVLNNRRIHFRLKVSSETKGFILPESVTLTDLRLTPRLNIASSQLSAEVRFAGGVALGVAHDISSDFISITFDDVPKSITEKKECRILVRASNGLTDIFFSNCTYVTTIDYADAKKTIFKTSFDENKENIGRPTRYKINPVRIKFYAQDLNTHNVYGEIAIDEVSLTGFSGSLECASSLRKPILGLVLTADDPKIKFCPVRYTDTKVGFRMINSSSQLSSTKWIEFLERHSNSEYKMLLNCTELADLFTESTFLKGERRKLFGKKMEPHLLNFNHDSNRLLYRRFLKADDSVHLSHHISIFRLTDFSWYLQEVISGLHKNKSIFSLKDEVISLLAQEAIHLPGAPGYFSGMYDPKISVNVTHWGPLSHSEKHFGASAALMDVSTIKAITEQELNITSAPANTLSAHEKHSAAKEFNPILIQMLDFLAKGQSNRVLSHELLKIGKAHTSTLSLLRDITTNDPLALVYKLNTYYAANATGVINSIFVFLSEKADDKVVQRVLSFVAQNKAITLGSGDLLLIGSNLEPLPLSQSKKTFFWFTADLTQIAEVAE